MAGYRYSRIMQPWLGIWPLSALAIFAGVKLSKFWGYNIPIIHWYLNDLICMPVFIAFSISMERFLSGKLTLCYSWRKILVYLIVICLVFEVFLPLKSDKYTADFFDLLCYMASAWLTFRFSPCIDKSLVLSKD